MFNFQKTPETIKEEPIPTVTKIVDDRRLGSLYVLVDHVRIGRIFFNQGAEEWRYESFSPQYGTLCSYYSIGQETMSLILNKLTELNEQESSVQ